MVLTPLPLKVVIRESYALNLYLHTKRTVRRKLLRSLQPCQEMVPLMSQSLDRRLNLIETAKLKLHLLVCAWCSRYLTQIGMIRSIIRDVSDHENENPTAGLSSEARGRIGKCFAQKVLSTARWSAISTVPRAKRPGCALQLTN